MTAALEKKIAEVYAKPLEEFVAARNALAKELAADGDELSARRVRGLRKPGVAAWAVNRVVDEHRRKVTLLLDAGESLRAAQTRLLKGERADDLHDLMRREREAVAELTHDAATLLEKSGHSAAASVREKISDTLYALVTNDDVRESALAGTLETDARRVGFGTEDVPIAAVRPAKPKRAEASAKRKRAEALEREADDAKAQSDQLAKVAEELEGRAAAARRRAKEAASKSSVAAKIAARARRDLQD